MTHPLILQLDSAGEPSRWINYERAVFYFCKDLVSWTYGENETTIFGGKSRMTGAQSFLDLPSIVAIKGKVGRRPFKVPTLTNRALFRRDHNICAYCATAFSPSDLTRDHVHPRSRGGPDEWKNVVTACGSCNRVKDDRTPEEAHMPLVYLPYAPSKAEYLILMNRTILADQMDFLLNRVGSNSRLLDIDFQRRFVLV